MDTESPIQIIPDDYCKPLEIGALFPAPGPLEVDLGCGDGSFVVAMAERYPARNFLGIERLLGRARKTCRKAGRRGLKNLRVLRLESGYSLRYLVPPGSAAVLHLSFPDPWPKRSHWPRRVFGPDFLEAAWRALAGGGELRVKTDDAPYHQWMRAILAKAQGFTEIEWIEPPDYPKTDFERRFVEKGLRIFRIRLVKSGG